jgi:hypothetical protein
MHFSSYKPRPQITSLQVVTTTLKLQISQCSWWYRWWKHNMDRINTKLINGYERHISNWDSHFYVRITSWIFGIQRKVCQWPNQLRFSFFVSTDVMWRTFLPLMLFKQQHCYNSISVSCVSIFQYSYCCTFTSTATYMYNQFDVWVSITWRGFFL